MAKDKRGGKRASAALKKEKPFDISKYDINEKKFKDREKQNLVTALKFMEDNFGDISEYTGQITKKYLQNAAGMHEHGGKYTKRYTAFENSYTAANLMVHEFTHAVAEELAQNYKTFGFKDTNDFYENLRSEAYRAVNKDEPKYDGRKWKDRAIEFPAIHGESYFEFGEKSGELSVAAFRALKRYWQIYKSK